MTAFKTRGGYGIFETYLERSLLWVRPKDGVLTPINYSPDKDVPSWSWMKFEGSITYIEAPFEKVNWTKDYESPFREGHGSEVKHFWEASGTSPTPVLRSKVRRFHLPQSTSKVMEGITLDTQTTSHPITELRCIIIGRKKSEVSGTGGTNYVMVIAPMLEREENAYVRIGVGTVQDAHIIWNSVELVEVH